MIYPPHYKCSIKRVVKPGFTLAELLIALAILGVIATFTIPKVLQAQQNQSNVAKAKEVASMLSAALKQHEAKGLLNSSTYGKDLFAYMNYVNYDTSSVIDVHPNYNAPTGTFNCSGGNPCIRLHNGSVLLAQGVYFSGTSSTHYISFLFDPDGVASGSSDDGPSKSVQFALYYNGLLRTRGTMIPNGCSSNNCTATPNSAYEPAWFHWD